MVPAGIKKYNHAQHTTRFASRAQHRSGRCGMSLHVTRWVFEYSRARPDALALLHALAWFADDNGIAFPSITTLSKLTRKSERQTQRLLRELVESGEVEVEAGAGRKHTNIYRITMPEHEPYTSPVAALSRWQVSNLEDPDPEPKKVTLATPLPDGAVRAPTRMLDRGDSTDSEKVSSRD